ncbi:MAG: hypothetical protein Q8R64_01610 [Sulfurimicrobium sp.]|nr:hypothetical protein [Sulfurimicrobium sp.]
MNSPSLASDQTLIESGLHHSRYVQRLLQSNPSLLEELHADLHLPWNTESMKAALAASEISDEASLKSALRMLRKRVMLRLIVRDISGLADLHEVMDNATQLAEVTTVFALEQLTPWLNAQYGQPIGDESSTVQDLIVVGMGKLGGGRTQCFVGYRPDFCLSGRRRNHRATSCQQPRVFHRAGQETDHRAE